MLLLFLLAVIILALGLGLIHKMLNMLEFSPSPWQTPSSYAEQSRAFLKPLPMKEFNCYPSEVILGRSCSKSSLIPCRGYREEK